MIHSIHTMTLGRYGQLDKTGDASLLKRSYNPFPVGWFVKRIERFQDQVREIFEHNDGELYNQFERLYMANKLLKISILYDALYNLMVMRAPIKAVIEMVEAKKLKEDRVKYYIDEVKELTGIEIREMKDLLKLQSEFTRLTDKFRERFPDKEPQHNEYSFSRAALSVFAIMEMPYDSSMTLAEFADLQTLAAERAKQYEKRMRDGSN